MVSSMAIIKKGSRQVKRKISKDFQENMIKILASCIESKFRFLKMEIEFIFLDTLKFIKAMFGVSPKTFDAIYMLAIAFRKFIISMVNPEMFFVAKVNQPIITTPAIGINHAFDFRVASDDLA